MSSNDGDGSKLGPNLRSPGDYEVGYCRPPREHQFKKGEASRNHKGRPCGINRPALDLGAVLMQPVAMRIKGKERKVPYPEALIQALQREALMGELRSAQIVINLMRELGILKPQAAFGPPTIHIHFVEPGDKINE